MKKLLQNQKKNKFVLCVLLLALLASLALMTGCGNNDAQDGDADADGQDAAKETLGGRPGRRVRADGLPR